MANLLYELAAGVGCPNHTLYPNYPVAGWTVRESDLRREQMHDPSHLWIES
jgi:hypothetical protein